jgi:hypothetical protein
LRVGALDSEVVIVNFLTMRRPNPDGGKLLMLPWSEGRRILTRGIRLLRTTVEIVRIGRHTVTGRSLRTVRQNPWTKFTEQVIARSGKRRSNLFSQRRLLRGVDPESQRRARNDSFSLRQPREFRPVILNERNQRSVRLHPFPSIPYSPSLDRQLTLLDKPAVAPELKIQLPNPYLGVPSQLKTIRLTKL